MNIDFLKIGLELSTGENCFSMNRGSFSYNFKSTNRTRFALVSDVHTEDKCILTFSAKNRSECVFEFCQEGSLLHMTCIKSPEGFNRWNLTFPCGAEEHFYGCGESYSTLDLKGENVRIWVAEHQNTKRIGKKLIRNTLQGNKPERTLPFSRYESYYAQPTFVSSGKYFMHVDTSTYSEFDFSKAGAITLRLQSVPDLWIGTAGSFTELSRLLSDLLGHQRKLPDWLYDGGIVAIQGGPDVIDAKLQKAVNAGAKIAGVWSQDWCGCRKTGFGYQVMWNWQYDNILYPNLPEKIRAWKVQGVHFLGYINPFIALEKDLYAEASRKGYCVKDKEGKDYLVTITTFPAAMVDFTNPEAYQWYKNIIKENMIGIGMSGWMADFGEYLPPDCVLHSGEDPWQIHNRWPAIWAQMNKEAIEETGSVDEVFFFTRAGHTGTLAASAMMWTGDQHVDWSVDDGLPSVIPATLSLAMSGFGITHSDVGGYTTVMNMTRSKDLLLRWMELCVFSPLWRSHEGNQPARNVQFDADDELLSQLARCTGLHTSLSWYIKKLVNETVAKGTPVMRPLFYYYDEPPAYTETTEYLLGPDLLVAPVIKSAANSRDVYFPNDIWIHAFSGKEYRGGHSVVEAPVGIPPVFVRKNSENCAALLDSLSSNK